MEIEQELANASLYSPYEINVHGRECGKCREFKPWIDEYGNETFTNHASQGTLGYHRHCKKCCSNSGYYRFVNGFNRGRHLKRAVLDGSLLAGTEDEGTIFEFCITPERPTGERYKVVGVQFEKQELERI